MIVRRNCYICFAITVICVAIATSTVCTYSFWLSDKVIEIQNAKLRRERLSNRIYCNRYCEKNVHMEFMYRIIEDVNIKKNKMARIVPIMLFLDHANRECSKMEQILLIVRLKNSIKTFISIEDSVVIKTGICIPC
ncbi:hypothetical protein Mgra_00009887, partial [Meloidogyne graminicola]